MTFWTFDIETQGMETFALGCAASERGDRLVMRNVDHVRAWFRRLDASDIVWSHGGGGFDFLFLIGAHEGMEWKGRTGGGSLLSCRPIGGPECRDTMGLVSMSLAEWTGKKIRLDLPCTCGEIGCEGYCAIRARGMSRAHVARLIERCMSDCEILLEAVVRDLARLRELGLDVDYQNRPRLTLGSMAWHTAARMAGIKPGEKLEWGEYDAGMRARYGGRSEVGAMVADSGHRYDLHAAYPAALRLPVPVGARRSLFGREASRAYQRGCAGAYHATLYVPDGLPLVPHRRYETTRGRAKRGRLVWSTGWIDTWLVREELQAAELHGARIESIHAAHVWSDEEPLYAPYIDHLWNARARARADGDESFAKICKLAANALSGKLQQGPEHDLVHVQSDASNPRLGWFWHGGRVWSHRLRHVPACARPIQAAVMLARTRVQVLDRIARHGDGFIYCDTDSAYTRERDDTDVGDGIGQWGYEGSLSSWLALGPKILRYIDQDGEEHVRARGIPRASWKTLDDLARGMQITRAGVARFRSSGGRLKERDIRQSIKSGGKFCGTRVVLDGGRTRALHRTEEGLYV